MSGREPKGMEHLDTGHPVVFAPADQKPTSSENLRDQIEQDVEAWFNSPDDLAGNDEMAAQVTDVVMRRVQARLDEQAAEINTLRRQVVDTRDELATMKAERDAKHDEAAEFAAMLVAAQLRAEDAEAERNRLRAAEKRVRELHSPDEYGDCKGCGLTRYEEAIPWTDCDTIAALDQGDGQETT